MNHAEIIEGNKLIAEFMGVHITPIGLRRNVMQKSYFQNELSYHTSWDWLMPVVEKIEQIKGSRLLMKPFACEILMFGKTVVNEAANTKIEATWLAVVEFIKWHNQNAGLKP